MCFVVAVVVVVVAVVVVVVANVVFVLPVSLLFALACRVCRHVYIQVCTLYAPKQTPKVVPKTKP